VISFDKLCRRTTLALAALLLLSLTEACVRLPTPDDAAKGPQVDDVVKRVKCDLYEAFREPMTAPQGYEWLHTWTAQANLNLIVTDLSQIAPGATFADPLKAVTVPLVVTNFSQSFNFGIGGQLNNTATRNETITFTVSLDELQKQYAAGSDKCVFPEYMDLQSDLGIKEWIAQALVPVELHDLDVGYHKPPKSGTSAAAVTKATEQLGPALNGKQFRSAIGIGHGFVVVGPKPPDCIPARREETEPAGSAEIALSLATVACDLFAFQPGPLQAYDLTKLDSQAIIFIAKTIRDIRQTIVALSSIGEATAQARLALENTAIALSVFVDPPIDTLAHQAQFIIVVNASASPSWTLLRFKGPSPATGSLLSLTNTKTHTLNLVLGPPGSLDAAGALAALQNGTAFTNALNSSTTTIITH
jgi:hypothetical protein